MFAHVSFRRLLNAFFAFMLVLSLACSLSIRHGHADVPVADTAEQIKPLGTGQEAPAFTVQDVNGQAFIFDPRQLDRPVIVITFRGGWCPYCNMHLSELRHVLPEISDMNIDVLFLSSDRSELLYSSLGDETRADIDGLDYRIYSDAEARAAIAFGIAFRAPERYLTKLPERGDDIERSSMTLHGILPVPAVYAIDADGVIRFAYANPDYKIRVPADELLEVATSLAPR